MFRLILLTFLFMVVAPVAFAQQMACAPGDQLLTGLAGLGERPFLVGAMSSGSKMTMTVNSETGAWSIVITAPDRTVSCLSVNGDGLDAPSSPPQSKPGKPL